MLTFAEYLFEDTTAHHASLDRLQTLHDRAKAHRGRKWEANDETKHQYVKSLYDLHDAIHDHIKKHGAPKDVKQRLKHGRTVLDGHSKAGNDPNGGSHFTSATEGALMNFHYNIGKLRAHAGLTVEAADMNEVHHRICPAQYKTWGIVHPRSGKLVSGQEHPTAGWHDQLKKELTKGTKDKKLRDEIKSAPEYAHVDHGYGEGHLMLRSVHNHNREAVMKAYHHLPHHPSGRVLVNKHDGNILSARNHIKSADFDKDDN